MRGFNKIAFLYIVCSFLLPIEGIHAVQADADYLKNFVNKWDFYGMCHFGFDLFTDQKSDPLTIKDGGKRFNPRDVVHGDIIFLRGRNVPDFFREVAPEIKVPYIIVSHGEHKDAFLDSYLPYLEDENIICWFGTHPSIIAHPKFHPIPLGVWVQKRFHKELTQVNVFKELRSSKKTCLVYANFADWTHPERSIVRKLFQDKPYCRFNNRIPFLSYLREMAQAKFTLSPRGLGIDCYRTWEAMLVGSIPIVKKSHLDSLLEGLPVLLIDDWSEVNEEFLNRKYEEMSLKEYDTSKLYVEYWIEKIYSIRDAYYSCNFGTQKQKKEQSKLPTHFNKDDLKGKL